MNLATISTKTMSSIELVELINSYRAEGKAELLHKNFMVKIENHPGIDSAKFLAQYKDSTGRYLKCFCLPKRECELMVMSESLAVQAKVYDRMTTYETVQSPVLTTMDTSLAAINAAHLVLLTVPGLDKVMAAACTLQCIQVATGVSMESQRLMLPHLQTAVPSLNATAVGVEIGTTARVANAMLTDAGLQFKNARNEWELTEAGREYGKLLPYNNNGHSGYQVLWLPEVVSTLRKAA